MALRFDASAAGPFALPDETFSSTLQQQTGKPTVSSNTRQGCCVSLWTGGEGMGSWRLERGGRERQLSFIQYRSTDLQTEKKNVNFACRATVVEVGQFPPSSNNARCKKTNGAKKEQRPINTAATATATPGGAKQPRSHPPASHTPTHLKTLMSARSW